MAEGSPDQPDDLIRQAQRVADRLAVVGPRMAARLAAREAPEATALLAGVRAVLQQLADLAADAEGRPRRAVPELGAHALADQLVVLVHDVAGHGEGTHRAAAHTLLRDLATRI